MLWALILLPAGLWGADGIMAELADRLRRTGLDAEECYRIREINFSKEDVRIYLTDGYLIFGNSVNGRRISAIFTSDVEGGDGEILMMPPVRSERLSLATFTESPNLNEHFETVHMLFTDDTAEELAKLVLEKPRVRRSPEMGHLMKQKWDGVINNLAGSLGIRLIYDILSRPPSSSGFFYAAIQGERLGNFDVVYDALAREQLRIGQVRYINERPIFNTWASFQARSFRNALRSNEQPSATLADYRIEAVLDDDLSLKAKTTARITVEGRTQEILFFGISPRMRITSVKIGGQECEIWRRDSLRSNLLNSNGNDLFLVAAPQPLAAGGSYEIEFLHEGRVVSEAGNGVFFVGSRGTWYPQHDFGFSHYDVTFRYPANLDLVFTGDILEDREENEWRITRRKTETPIRLAGFNVGNYETLKIGRSGYSIEVYANREVETALQPKQRYILAPQAQPQAPVRRLPSVVPDTVVVVKEPVEKPDPTVRLKVLAEEIGDAFEFMSATFGPPPTRTLTVSPIPGLFGQGFPGLLYISTLAYLDPEERPDLIRDDYDEYFFSELLHSHEVAHQWWGNIIAANGYQDEWLMEALADYSSLLMLEKTQGKQAFDTVLEFYKSNLLVRNEEGHTLESAGPISWGQRLDSSQARAWRTITYQKGAWIMHMLRQRLGSERFLEALGELCRRYRYMTVTIEDFRKLMAEYMPKDNPDSTLEEFYDNWVYNTGVPALKFSHSVKGKSPKVRVWGTVTQSDVADDFSVYVPIEFQFEGQDPITRWVRTDQEPAPFDYTFEQQPSKVVFNPDNSVLVVRN